MIPELNAKEEGYGGNWMYIIEKIIIRKFVLIIALWLISYITNLYEPYVVRCSCRICMQQTLDRKSVV